MQSIPSSVMGFAHTPYPHVIVGNSYTHVIVGNSYPHVIVGNLCNLNRRPIRFCLLRLRSHSQGLTNKKADTYQELPFMVNLLIRSYLIRSEGKILPSHHKRRFGITNHTRWLFSNPR